MSDSELSDSDYSESVYSTDDEDQGAPTPAPEPAPRRVPGLSLALGGGGGPAAAAAAAAPNNNAPKMGVPRLGVPSLGLPPRSGEPADGIPATARGAGPAIPSLALGARLGGGAGGGSNNPPASARPHYQPKLAAAAAPPRAAAGDLTPFSAPDVTTDEAAAVDGTAVQLVSFAFSLPSAGRGAAGSSSSSKAASLGVVRERCVKTLGVAPEELRFFELRELPHGVEAVPQGCAGVGVAVRKSGFSLAAMESLIADNQRLTAASDRSAAALESLQGLVREQHQTVAKAQLLAAEKEAETRRLQDRCRYLEREVVALRQQLQRSDTLRLQGQQALDELKREFESLMHNILADGAGGLDDATLSETTSLHHASDYQGDSVTGVASAP